VLTDVFSCDLTRVRLLTQLGFERFRVWDYVNERDLDEPFDEPDVPDGFIMRGTRMSDAGQLAIARNHSFEEDWTGELYRSAVMEKPGYDPAREIVAQSPDGRIAAFTVYWVDERNKIGHFEPVGTHRDFHRRGLARAVMLHAMRQMKALGMATVTVNHNAENLAALKLYKSLGFTKRYETYGFRRSLSTSQIQPVDEETLPGGNTVGAVRIGDAVHKLASPWTPTVHALLRHLEDAGFDGAPRALGFDGQGREMLSYLPGETAGDRVPWPAWAFADVTLTQVGQWLRRVHDATADFVPPVDERWFAGRTMQPGLIVGHQDAAPYNAVMNGDRLVGFFDWDTAGPSSRDFDLAFAALSWVPLYPPSEVERLGFHDFEDRSRRLHLLLDAYGYDSDRRAFGAVIVQRARRQATVIRRMAVAGDSAAIALLPVAGHLERSASDVETLPDHFWTR
jgi:ribosomal protein S18 acetylase RimI-like enzyme